MPPERIRPPAIDGDPEVQAPAYSVPVADRARRWRQWWAPALRTRHGLIGVVAGLVAAGIPAAILGVTFVSFVFTATPDGLFFVGLLVAPFVLVAGVGLVAAVAFARRPATRHLGLGYLAGVALVAAAGVVAFVVVSVVALLAEAWR